MKVQKHYTGIMTIEELTELLIKHLKEQGFVNPTLRFVVDADPKADCRESYARRVLTQVEFHADDKK